MRLCHVYEQLWLMFILCLAGSMSSFGQEASISENIWPEARWGHTMIHDPVRNNLLLFGGISEKGGDYRNDTWIWQDGNWRKLTVPGPGARGFCAATFHESRQTILLHGGRGDNRQTYTDLWEWDGRSWKMLDPSDVFKADHHGMVYLPKDTAIMAYGGWNGHGVSSDTWIWQDGWTKVTSENPPARAAFGMTYDSNLNQVLLHGGLWINGQYADIWAWSNDQWIQKGGPYDNSSLDHLRMIFDESRNQIVGFGGKNYRYVTQDKTFTLEEGKMKVLSEDGPEARHSFGLTYNRNEATTYLFGGKKYDGQSQMPLADLWRWNGISWEQIFTK